MVFEWQAILYIVQHAVTRSRVLAAWKRASVEAARIGKILTPVIS